MAWQQGRIVSGQASWASSKQSLRGYFHTQRQGIFRPRQANPKWLSAPPPAIRPLAKLAVNK